MGSISMAYYIIMEIMYISEHLDKYSLKILLYYFKAVATVNSCWLYIKNGNGGVKNLYGSIQRYTSTPLKLPNKCYVMCRNNYV